MDRIRERIVEHIEQDWPITLRLWDTLERQINLNSYHHLPEPASAIRLARECNVPSILPAAFYHLSRLSVFDDGNGAYDADSGRRTAEWGLLSAQDLLCLMKGSRRLKVAVCGILSDFPCCESDCTTINRLAVFKGIRDACRHSCDILRITRLHIENRPYEGKICYTCYSQVRSNLAEFREELWTNLPNFFSL